MAPPFPTPETSPEMPDNPGPTCTAPLDTFSVTDVIKNLKVSSESLTRIFGQLESQALSVANHGQGGCVFSDTMERFERQLEEQDQAHSEGINEIKLILKDHVDAKLLEHLKEIAEREIEEEIDKVVQEQVAEYIATLMPQALQDDVTMQRKELEELRINLLNSENRRANASIRMNHPDTNLYEIYMSNGGISERFPKTLQQLFGLELETLKALMKDYELDVSDTRDRNLNSFMQFCGVSYQMVRTGSETGRLTGMEMGLV